MQYVCGHSCLTRRAALLVICTTKDTKQQSKQPSKQQQLQLQQQQQQQNKQQQQQQKQTNKKINTRNQTKPCTATSVLWHFIQKISKVEYGDTSVSKRINLVDRNALDHPDSDSAKDSYSPDCLDLLAHAEKRSTEIYSINKAILILQVIFCFEPSCLMSFAPVIFPFYESTIIQSQLNAHFHKKNIQLLTR